MPRFKAFISYKHVSSTRFAENLELAIKAYAKPIYRPPIPVFRDEKYLRPGSDLPKLIGNALKESEFFIFLASPQAAASEWVRMELEQWCEDEERRRRLIIVLTEGTIQADARTKRVDWQLTDALPGSLADKIEFVPLYVDLSWARRDEQQTLLDADYKKAINGIVAALRNIDPIELSGQEILQHRRNVRVRNAFIGAISALAVLLAIAAGVAVVQRQAAVRSEIAATAARDEAVRRLYALQLSRAAEIANEDPGLALELLDDTERAPPALREFAWKLYSRLNTRQVLALGGLHNYPRDTGEDFAPTLAISDDGTLLAASGVRKNKVARYSPDSFVREISIWNIATGARLASLNVANDSRRTPEQVKAIAFSPDNLQLVVATGYPYHLQVWDLASGQARMLVEGQSVNNLRFAPAARTSGTTSLGSSRLIAETDSTLIVWDQLGSAPRKFRSPASYLGGTVIVDEGTALLAATPQGIVRWDLATGSHRTLRTRSAWVTGAPMAVSPDGQHLAVAEGRAIRLVRIQDGQTLRVFRAAHTANVSLLLFTGDGQRVVSGARDHTVRVWDAASGIAVLALRGPRAEINSLGISPDGRRIVAGANDATAFVWDVAAPTIRPAVQIPIQREGSCVAFAPEGRVIAVATAGKVVVTRAQRTRHDSEVITRGKAEQCGVSPGGQTLYAVDENMLVTVRDGETGDLRAQLGPIVKSSIVRLSPSGGAIAAFVGATRFSIWNAGTGELRATVNIDGEFLGSLDFVGDGIIVGIVRQQGKTSVRSWDATTGRALAAAPIEGDVAFDHAASCAQSHFYAGYSKTELHIFDVRASAPTRRLHLGDYDMFSPEHRPTRIVFSRDCNALAIGDELGSFSVWNVAGGSKRFQVAAHTAQMVTRERSPRMIAGYSYQTVGPGLVALAFSPDGRTVASGGGTFAGSGELKLWDALHGNQLAVLPAESGIVSALGFSPDGTTLGVLLSRSPSDFVGTPVAAELWDTRQEVESGLLASAGDTITSVSFSADGKRLAVGGTDGIVRMWDTTTNREIESWPRSAPILALGRDAEHGSLLSAVAEEDGQIELRDVSSGDRVGRFGKASVVALSPDTFSVAVPYEVWNRRTGRKVSLDVRQNEVSALAFSEDGNVLASGAENGSIEIWDVGAGRMLHSLKCPEGKRFCHTQRIQALAVSQNHMRIASLAGYDDVDEAAAELVLWDARSGKPLHEAFEPSNVIAGLALSPDARLLATSGSLGTVRGQPGFVHIWDTNRLELIRALVGHRGAVTTVGFSPDGKQLATADEHGIVRLWDLSEIVAVPAKSALRTQDSPRTRR